MNHKKSIKALTIYDIADLANTSASTVSAVLNNKWEKRRISKKLADKILSTAADVGFTINTQAQALRKERSGMIGMIVPMYDNRYFGEMVQTFEKHCLSKGYFPLVTCTFRDTKLELKAAQSFLSHRVEAIICTGAVDPDTVSKLCATHGVPTINLDLPGSVAPSVVSDNYEGSRLLTNGLIDMIRPTLTEGKSVSNEIAFIGGDNSDSNTKERLRGFIKAHEEAGLKLNKSKIFTNGYESSAAEDSMAQLVSNGADLPVGIFVNSTISLEGVIKHLTKTSKSLPSAPKIVCFDWDPIAKMLFPEMLMARQNVDEMLKKVFQLLDEENFDSNTFKFPISIIT